MSTKSIIYRPDQHSLQEIQVTQDQGIALLCPICGTELIIALDIKTANEKGVHPGIFCPNNQSHIHRLVSLADAHNAVWDLFRDNGDRTSG